MKTVYVIRVTLNDGRERYINLEKNGIHLYSTIHGWLFVTHWMSVEDAEIEYTAMIKLHPLVKTYVIEGHKVLF